MLWKSERKVNLENSWAIRFGGAKLQCYFIASVWTKFGFSFGQMDDFRNQGTSALSCAQMLEEWI